MYTMGSLLHSGSAEQKAEWLPKVASGELRLQAFGVSEPNSGTDTLSLETVAVKDGDEYVINGQKMWTSRAEYSDAMLLLARTDYPEPPREDARARAKALTLFIVDMRGKVNCGNGIEITPVQTMMNHSTTTIFFDNLRVPAANIIGGEGNGFKTVLGAMNAERVLIAAECIGDGRFFIDRATQYAKDRSVFGRPIGANQGIAFPIAEAYAEVEAAALMVNHAADLIDGGATAGEQANLAKYLAAEASVRLSCCDSHSLTSGLLISWSVAHCVSTLSLLQLATATQLWSCAVCFASGSGKQAMCACKPTADTGSRRNSTSNANGARPGSTVWPLSPLT